MWWSIFRTCSGLGHLGLRAPVGQDSWGPQFWVTLPEVTLCTTFSLVLVPVGGKRCSSSQDKQLDTMWGQERIRMASGDSSPFKRPFPATSEGQRTDGKETGQEEGTK